jgi:hypothetical protein
VLPADSLEKRYVKSFEFRPGNRRVVHHAFLFVDTSGLARRLDDATAEPGYPCLGSPGFVPAATLGLWAPGWPIPPLPQGLGQEIPKGADLVVQIHYHPSGKPEEDRSSIGLKFAEKPEREVESLYLENTQLTIPAGDSHHVETVTATLPMDADLVSILPHAHYLGRDLAVDAYFPTGAAIRLVHIPAWDLNWQGYYYYSRPIRLPRKTQIKLTYLYDNSASNPRNPSHPPVRVTAGESTRSEMQLAILGLAPASGADPANFRRLLNAVMLTQRLRGGQDIAGLAEENVRLAVLRRVFDRNHDGKLDDSERRALASFVERMADVFGGPLWPVIRWGFIAFVLTLSAGSLWLLVRFARRRVPVLR